MCRWMGSPFHGWIDYNERDRTFSGLGDPKIQGGRDLKMERFLLY